MARTAARLPRTFSRALAHDAGRWSGVAASLDAVDGAAVGPTARAGREQSRRWDGAESALGSSNASLRSTRQRHAAAAEGGGGAVLPSRSSPGIAGAAGAPSAGRGVPVGLDPRPSGGPGARLKGGALWMLPAPQCVPPVASAGLQSPSAAQPQSRAHCGPAGIWRGSTLFPCDHAAEARRIAREGLALSPSMHRTFSQWPFGDWTGGGGSVPSWGADSLNKQHREEKLLGYSPEQLYDVVADVGCYAEFLPWCIRSEVLWKRNNTMEAELEIGFQVLKERYTSRVTLNEPHSVLSTVKNSIIFEYLNCVWEFHPGPVRNSTHVFFSVDFQFRSALYRQVSNLFFEEVVSCMVESFEKRCRTVYGPAVHVDAKMISRRTIP